MRKPHRHDRMAIIRPGDRVRMKHWTLYKGEMLPDIPPSKWTGTVVSAWGLARFFCQVERDHDGRVIPIMQNHLIKIDEPTRKVSGKKNKMKVVDDYEPTLF